MSDMEKNKNIFSYILFVGSILLIAFGIFGTIWGRSDSVEAVDNKTVTPNPKIITPTVEQSELSRENISPENIKDPDQLIEYYKTHIEKNSQEPDTPAYLFAIGNLYKIKKMDCASAIPYYERIILEFPDWEGIKSVYPELSTCYEETNDYRGKIWLHDEMMKRFPPDSQEYLFAKQSLGLN